MTVAQGFRGRVQVSYAPTVPDRYLRGCSWQIDITADEQDVTVANLGEGVTADRGRLQVSFGKEAVVGARRAVIQLEGFWDNERNLFLHQLVPQVGDELSLTLWPAYGRFISGLNFADSLDRDDLYWFFPRVLLTKASTKGSVRSIVQWNITGVAQSLFFYPQYS